MSDHHLSLLTLIPARMGSKGLPGKNSRILGNKPLLAWTWDVVRLAGLQSSLCVLSTDDQSIASIGHSLGMPVPYLRKASLATDEASLFDVALEALDWAATKQKFSPDHVLLLQPTSPFRNESSLIRSLHIAQNTDIDCVVGVKAVDRTLRTLYYGNDNTAEPLLVPLDTTVDTEVRRQAIKKMYTPNGALYLCRTTALLREKTFLPLKSRGIVMDKIESIDIDTPDDWTIATAVAALHRQ